jgi:hypothetical protein
MRAGKETTGSPFFLEGLLPFLGSWIPYSNILEMRKA